MFRVFHVPHIKESSTHPVKFTDVFFDGWSWSNARAKSVNGPTNTRSTFSSDSFNEGLNLRALLMVNLATVIGLCSFKIEVRPL